MADSNEKMEIIIWGRTFDVPIEYDCYRGEEVTPIQEKALKDFSTHLDWIQKSKKYVEEFCRESLIEDDENTEKDNIFSYIKPECIFIKRDSENPRVALMCKYKYDLEHGLAIVFAHDGKIKVGIQDIIL